MVQQQWLSKVSRWCNDAFINLSVISLVYKQLQIAEVRQGTLYISPTLTYSGTECRKHNYGSHRKYTKVYVARDWIHGLTYSVYTA